MQACDCTAVLKQEVRQEVSCVHHVTIPEATFGNGAERGGHEHVPFQN